MWEPLNQVFLTGQTETSSCTDPEPEWLQTGPSKPLGRGPGAWGERFRRHAGQYIPAPWSLLR